jgi:hypothetical protein
MKYIRVVLAVEGGSEAHGPHGLSFDERLDVFIEEDPAVRGAYVGGPYDTREEALGTDFRG